MRPPRDRRRLNLIFDADDTLWDSNIHFIEAERAFCAAAIEAGSKTEREQIAAMIRRCELEVIQTHGYGRGPYVVALSRVARELSSNGDFQQKMGVQVDRIGERLTERHCELLPGVEGTLAELANRHRLLLFTKGQRDEQLRKLYRSGLGVHFSHVGTPREKNVDSYLCLLSSANLDPSDTHMIGNSPKSDINPAIRAGLGAVFIPHQHTWVMEQEEIEKPERVVVLSYFAALLEVF
jgi:putative hydrolase of the HAD superfamily